MVNSVTYGERNLRDGKTMRDDQSVAGMVDAVLERSAKARAVRTGESSKNVLEPALDTEAARQLRELGSGPHRRERADEWQANVAQERVDALGRRSPLEASELSADG